MKTYMRSALVSALILSACKDQGGAHDDVRAVSPSTGSAAGFTSTGPVAGADGWKPGSSGTSGSNDATGASGQSASVDARVAGAGLGGSGNAGANSVGGAGSGRGGAAGRAGEAGMMNGSAGEARAGAGGNAAPAGSGSTGSCMKGQTKPSEVIVIGDSFIAINHAITNQIQTKARAAGALGQSDKYRDLSVSGTTLANNQIPGQYASAVKSGPVKVVLMNGGGNDCLQRNDPNGAFMAANALFETMGGGDTESVVYFFYPDPAGALGGGSLKSCLDTLRPQIESLCGRLTKPKCYFIDLRSIWQPSYAMGDGIHPTQQGGAAVGDAVWTTMQEHCIAQ